MQQAALTQSQGTTIGDDDIERRITQFLRAKSCRAADFEGAASVKGEKSLLAEATHHGVMLLLRDAGKD
jgi:hypothetical protein